MNSLGALSKPTAASCRRSSRRVAVVARSQLYFFFMFSCIFLICSWDSFTSAKNWGRDRHKSLLTFCGLQFCVVRREHDKPPHLHRCCVMRGVHHRELKRCYFVYLVVGSVLFLMSLDAAAQLKDPAPLSLQRSCEGLEDAETRMGGNQWRGANGLSNPSQ